MLVVCIGGLALALPPSVVNVRVSTASASPEQPPLQLPVEQLRQLAQKITVKVWSADFLGSGIVIQRQGAIYTVLTTEHLLRAGDPPFRIQMPDGRIYLAKLPQAVSFKGNDLALLQFSSTDVVYPVASLRTSANSVLGDYVFAGGFPFADDASQEKGFVLTIGQVSLVLDKALEGGYRIGYTNEIAKGMSGGPLLNHRGEVVGVNGMHAYPLWDAPSVFQDGSSVNQALQEMINRFSWAVPIETIIQLAPLSIELKDF